MPLRRCLPLFLMCVGFLTFGWPPSAVPRAGAASGEEMTRSDRVGLNVSEFTDVNAMGFLAPDGVTPWGRLHSDETERLFIAQGDTVYVAFESGRPVKPGDLFTVYGSSDSVSHPLGGETGAVISFLGKVVLEDRVRDGLYKGEIVESYRQIQVGYPVIPFRSVSPCVRPVDPDWKRFKTLESSQIPVVAGKHLYELLSQYSVVYLAHGLQRGIRRGNLFKIMGTLEASQATDLIIGYLLVLDSRPRSATGIVITSKREFSTGTFVRPVNLKETLRNLAVFYGENDTALNCTDMVETLFRLKKKIGSDLDLPPALDVLWRLPTCFTRSP